MKQEEQKIKVRITEAKTLNRVDTWLFYGRFHETLAYLHNDRYTLPPAGASAVAPAILSLGSSYPSYLKGRM